jgi:hypothetical protein
MVRWALIGLEQWLLGHLIQASHHARGEIPVAYVSSKSFAHQVAVMVSTGLWQMIMRGKFILSKNTGRMHASVRAYLWCRALSGQTGRPPSRSRHGEV